MRKIILTIITLILALSLLSSCAGVSQEDYDKVSNDLAATQTQMHLLQDDLTNAQEQIQPLLDTVAATQAELTKVQEEIQSLKSDKTAANTNRATALAYAEFLDIVMQKIWLEREDIEPRFFFSEEAVWLVDLRIRADYMKDTKLITIVEGMEMGISPDMTEVVYYCLGKIEKALD